MEGRYGPYVSDGEIHATLPKGADPQTITLEQALPLLAARAEKGGGKKKKKKAAKPPAKQKAAAAGAKQPKKAKA
jgi:DNA topoisomerase-1